jgi:lipoprotein-anchoring transpeptidase ErfK/SrfK
VSPFFPRLFGLLSVAVLAACGGPKPDDKPPQVVAGYEAVEDNGYLIPAVDPELLTADRAKREVTYTADDAPGTVVVDTFARKLYFVEDGGVATQYAIAVGREGLSFRGTGTIGRMEEWPSWQPTGNMVRTRPDLYAEFAGGLPGGLDNPLGARALYLYRGGRDSMFRIHGTIQNESIGHATSAGCIRLFNQDAIELYNRVERGTVVKVRSLEESLAVEGPYMDDAWGRAVPDTPENQAQKLDDLAHMDEINAAQAEADAKAAEKAQKEAEKADKKRIQDCKRHGIAEVNCPPLPATDMTAGTAGSDALAAIEGSNG